MKRILFPVDFSYDIDKNVSLNYAISLAKKAKAKIILYHSINTPAYASNVAFEVIPVGDEETKIVKKLSLMHEHVAFNNPDLEIESYPTSSLRPIADEIIDAAVDKDVDLIVMSTNGTNKLADIFIISNTIDIIMKSFIPVLVVPEYAPFQQIAKVVYATNFHYSDIEAIKQLCEIAAFFNATVTVIHFQHEDLSYASEFNMMNAFKEEVDETVKMEGLTFKLLKGGDINECLDKYIQEENTDILALSTHKRGMLQRLFGRSISKKMAYHTTILVLVFRINREE